MIVGGVEVDPEFKYPWMTALLRTSGSLFCGGSLINESWVLTAAHCSTNTNPSSVSVSVRRHDLTRSSAAEGGYDRKVAEIFVHPQYQPLSFNRDVALWKLAAPITEVDIIQLDNDGDYSVVGELATVSGWGVVREGGASTSDVLREVDVPIMSNQDCLRDYPGSITDFMLCAGYPEGGKDACQGDSGGPLFYNNRQIGVVSWGQGCARPDNAGVYARVSALSDWIWETIAENS